MRMGQKICRLNLTQQYKMGVCRVRIPVTGCQRPTWQCKTLLASGMLTAFRARYQRCRGAPPGWMDIHKINKVGGLKSIFTLNIAKTMLMSPDFFCIHAGKPDYCHQCHCRTFNCYNWLSLAVECLEASCNAVDQEALRPAAECESCCRLF